MLKRIKNYCCAIRSSLNGSQGLKQRYRGDRQPKLLPGRKIFIGLFLCLTVIVGEIGTTGRLLAGDVKKATTSKQAKNSAIQSIPFEKFKKTDRARISKIISTRNIYRRLPVHVAQCDPKFYDFCLKNPDLVVNIWRVFDITELDMKKVGKNKYWGRDEEGTEGTVEFLYRDHEKTIVFIEGKYDGPLITKPVAGRALMILRTGFVRNPNGKYYATSQLDTFTQIDNVAIDFFTRTLQPLLGHIADNNFVQTSAFIGSLSRTAEANPSGIKGLSKELKDIDETTRADFIKVVDGVAARATRHASYETKAKSSRQFR